MDDGPDSTATRDLDEEPRPGRTGEPVGSPEPPRSRMVVALLSLVGFFVSFYLLAHSLGWTGPLVCGVGDCATVQASEYARLGPVPVAGIGTAGYLVLLGVALLGLQPGWRDSRAVGLFLLGGTLIGVVFSAWLTYLEAAVIHAWCQWCVVSAILITLAFFASVPEWGRMRSAPGGAP